MKTYQDLFNASEAEREELTDLEVMSIALNVVADYLKQQGSESISLLNREPAIISSKTGSQSDLVVVTVSRYPRDATPPEYPQHIIETYGRHVKWMGIALAHELDPFDPEDTEGMPLMKGFAVIPKIGQPVLLSDLV